MAPPSGAATEAAVAGVSGVIRDGFISVLARMGYRTGLPADPEGWLDEHPEGTLLISGAFLSAIATRRHPQALIVAMLEPDHPPDRYRLAIRLGAAGILTAAMTSAEVDLGLQAARLGYLLVPHQVAEALAVRLMDAPAGLELDHNEQVLLQAVASGASVADLARALDLSTRQTSRRLKALWARLGAPNRTLAVINATRWGLLKPEETTT